MNMFSRKVLAMPISFINKNKSSNSSNKKYTSNSINKISRSAFSMQKFIKQISLICTLVFLSVFFYSARTRRPVEIIPVMAVPVTNKVIILDAGHGTPDEGAESSSGTLEAPINLQITLKVQKLLESSGATVILTRSDDNSIYEIDAKTIAQKKVSDIHNRVKIGNNSSADVFVSIHLNKISESQYSGWQTFYKNNDENSKKLATSIQNNLNETIASDNDRTPHTLSNVYIMKNVEIPITIVECGFLSNPEDEARLKTDEYQESLAWGIYNGIMGYFE